MSNLKEGLNEEVLAAIVAFPGQSVINIIELFSGRASKSTIREHIKKLTDNGLVVAKKETVVRPTEAGKIAAVSSRLGNASGQIPREE